VALEGITGADLEPIIDLMSPERTRNAAPGVWHNAQSVVRQSFTRLLKDWGRR
jgi:hypothetical protein